MTKYRVTVGNTTTEFAQQADAAQMAAKTGGTMETIDFALPEVETPSPALIQAQSNMSFGRRIIAEVSAEPSINSLDTNGTMALLSDLAPLQMMLMTGAIQTVYLQLLQMPPSDAIPQPMLDKYIAKFRDYLGVT